MNEIAAKAKIGSHGHPGCRNAYLRSRTVSDWALSAARNLMLQAIITSHAMKKAMPEMAENLSSYH